MNVERPVPGDCRSGMFGSKRHNFRPRYDSVAPDLTRLYENGDFRVTEESLRLLTTERYVCDICVRCGATVNRDQKVERAD